MKCAVDTNLYIVNGVLQSQGPSSTQNQAKDEADRSKVRQHIDKIGCKGETLNSCLFLLYLQGIDEMEDLNMANVKDSDTADIEDLNMNQD
jgi:hypothetical protein